MVNLYSWVTSGLSTKALTAILLGLALASCSDTDGPPADLLGTAASGAAIKGTVYVIDAGGVELSKPINNDGTFKFDVRKQTAPFMLKTVPDNVADPVLYSYAETAGGDVNVRVNITPLTNIVMYTVNGNADPATLYNSWASSFGTVTTTAVVDAQAVVNANLSTQFTAFSLDPMTYDFIKTRFLVNSTSVDALLDGLTVDLTAGVSISVAGIAGPLPYDPAIVTTGYDIGGTVVALAGNYTLIKNVAIDGGAASASVLLARNVLASSVPTVPTGNTQIVEDTFRSFYGSEGTIVINTINATNDATTPTTVIAVVDATITPAGGVAANYVATYTYTLNP